MLRRKGWFYAQQVARKTVKVHRISRVRRSLVDDQRERMKRYYLSMGIRTGCFLGAVAVEGVWRWLLLGGAVLLPMVAVVLANASRENTSSGVSYLPQGELPAVPMDTGK